MHTVMLDRQWIVHAGGLKGPWPDKVLAPADGPDA